MDAYWGPCSFLFKVSSVDAFVEGLVGYGVWNEILSLTFSRILLRCFAVQRQIYVSFMIMLTCQLCVIPAWVKSQWLAISFAYLIYLAPFNFLNTDDGWMTQNVNVLPVRWWSKHSKQYISDILTNRVSFCCTKISMTQNCFGSKNTR